VGCACSKNVRRRKPVRNFGKKSRGGSLLVSREQDGKAKCGTILPNCSLRNTGVQRKDAWATGGRNYGRIWLGKGSNNHRSRRRWRSKKRKKKRKMMMMMMMMMMMITTTTINAY
jgi:hypothetical protein